MMRDRGLGSRTQNCFIRLTSVAACKDCGKNAISARNVLRVKLMDSKYRFTSKFTFESLNHRPNQLDRDLQNHTDIALHYDYRKSTLLNVNEVLMMNRSPGLLQTLQRPVIVAV